MDREQWQKEKSINLHSNIFYIINIVYRNIYLYNLMTIWYPLHIPLTNSRWADTGETNLSQVVKVVLMVDPFVVGLQTIRLVSDVFDIGTKAVEELAFK